MDGVDAGLSDRVTDSGVCALVEAGCGAKLTSLSLWGEKLFGLWCAGR